MQSKKNPLPLADKRQALLKKLKRRLKTAQKALQKVEGELSSALGWEKEHRLALLLQSNLYQIKPGMKVCSFKDWETGEEHSYAFKKKPQDEVDRRFRRSRKLKNGVIPLTDQVQRAKAWVKELEELSLTVETLEDELLIDQLDQRFSKTKKPENSVAPLPYREFISPTGTLIWVGKSAKDNDKLTFTHANGRDTWLHVDGYPGSHVVIRSEDPDKETLDLAVQLAVTYSKAKGANYVDVIITECKHLVRQRKPGAVSVSKHRKVRA